MGRAGGDHHRMMGRAGGDRLRMMGRAGGDLLRMMARAGGDRLRMMGRADGDLLRMMGRAGGDRLRMTARAGGDLLRMMGRMMGSVGGDHHLMWRAGGHHHAVEANHCDEVGGLHHRDRMGKASDHHRDREGVLRIGREGVVTEFEWEIVHAASLRLKTFVPSRLRWPSSDGATCCGHAYQPGNPVDLGRTF